MSNHIGPVTRTVVCAANRLHSGIIVLGARHFDHLMHFTISTLFPINKPSFNEWEQGFIDQWGQFMDRFEACRVAGAAGQLNIRRIKTSPVDELFSEDLY